MKQKWILALSFFGMAALAPQAATLNGAVRKLTDSTKVVGAKLVLLTGTTRSDSTISDSTGAYSFLNVATGTKQILVTGTGYAPVTSASLNIFNANGTTTTNFYLGAPATLSGKVRKATDSTALANAWVYLRRTSTTSTIQDSAKTDANGAFSFANLAPGTPNYYLTATLTDYVTNSNSNIVLAGGASVTSNLYLTPVLPGSITGKVRRAPDSVSIAGAQIYLRRTSATAAIQDSTVSDASGNYGFSNLVAGTTAYFITFNATGFASVTNSNIVVNNGANTVSNVTLTALGKISGRVRKLSDSTSIQNALVLLRRGTTDTSAVLDSARTDSSGTYAFSNLTASTQYRAYASIAGFVSASNTGITVNNGATTTSNFFLGTPASLSGKVRKATDSTALANAWVYLRRTSTTSTIQDSAKTDANGSFAFANLAPGAPNYYLTATLADYVTNSNSNIALGSGASVTSNIYLTPVLPGSITGKLRRTGDSVNIAGAQIYLRRTSATAAIQDSTVSDASGNYGFSNLVAGTPNYFVTFNATGYASATNSNVVVNNGANTVSNAFLTTLGKISGRVRKLSDSTSIKNAVVLLRRGTTDTSAVLDSAKTDSLGGYTFSNLSASTQYRLYAAFSGFVNASNTGVTVNNGATTTSNFFLGLPGSISGKVRKASDSVSVLKNTLVYLRRTSTTAAIQDSAKTDSLGNYSFTNLAFGTPNYFLTTSLTGYVAATNSNVAVASGAATTSNFYLTLIVPGSITGKVRRGADSTNIAGARLMLRRGTSDTTAVLDSTKSDSVGNYTFANLTPLLTDYRVTASATGLISVTNANITVPNGGVATSNFLLVAPGSISGKVRRLPDSTAFKGVMVVIRRGNNNNSAGLDSIKTDSLGNFAFSNLAPANNYRVTGSFTGYTTVTNANVLVSSSVVTTSNLFLTLAPRGRIYGKVGVSGDSLTVLKNALLQLRRGSDTVAVADSARTDSTGRYTFVDVLAGTPNYWITASKSGYASQTTANIAVVANDSVAANFALSAAVIAVRPEMAFNRTGFTARRLGSQWLVTLPSASQPRTFSIIDLLGNTRYQTAVPAGVNQLTVPGETVAPGAIFRLK